MGYVQSASSIEPLHKSALLPAEVVIGPFAAVDHGRLKKHAELRLDPALAPPMSKIKATRDFNRQRRGENGIFAQEIDLQLHALTQKAGDIDVVPRLLVVASGTIVVDVNEMILNLVSGMSSITPPLVDNLELRLPGSSRA